MEVRIRSHVTGAELCAHHPGEPHLAAAGCVADGWVVEQPDLEHGIPRRILALQQAVRLRLQGQPLFLVAAPDGGMPSGYRLVLRRDLANATGWAIGLQQPWRSELVQGRSDGPPTSGSSDGSALPQRVAVDVWLLASESYGHLVARLRRSFELAGGEPVHMHVLRFRDIRDVTKKGWNTGLSSFAYTYRKILLIFEALLQAALGAPRASSLESPHMLLIMDLDMQVFPGWMRALRSCLAGKTGADVCLLQQPPNPLEVANCGFLVLKGGSPAATALPHVLLARYQSLEVFLHAPSGGKYVNFVDQPTINAILQRVRRGRGPRSLRWGIYNPAIAPVRVGMGSMKPLSLCVHHATGPVTLAEKLEGMDLLQRLVARARSLCGDWGPRCLGSRVPSAVEGPLLPLCLWLLDEDPHLGPPLECHRMFGPLDWPAILRRRELEVHRTMGLHSDVTNRPEGREIYELITSFGVAS